MRLTDRLHPGRTSNGPAWSIHRLSSLACDDAKPVVTSSSETGKEDVKEREDMRPEADVELRRAESSPAQRNHRRHFPIIRECDIHACPVRRSASRSLRPDEGRHAYAAWRVLGVERLRARRFCSIKGSSTSPQLMHRKTVPSVEYSGRDSTIIKPLHFLQVMFPPPDGFFLVHTTANVAMKD
jgi:hypothetical protein